MGRAHATAAAANSTAPLSFAPPHGTFPHVLRTAAVEDRIKGRGADPAQAVVMKDACHGRGAINTTLSWAR